MFDRTIDAVPSIELSEYSSAFCRIAAKTGKKNSENDSEEWLPRWTHLYDTACVMQHLVYSWFPMLGGKRLVVDFPRACRVRFLKFDFEQGVRYYVHVVSSAIPYAH